MQTISAALEGCGRHRLRTVLSMAGVMLAVAVTITTLAVNEGARREALREAERLGLNTVIVRHPGRVLLLKDAERLPALVPVIAAVSPSIELESAVAGPLSAQPARIAGVTSAYVAIRRLSVADGRLLHAEDDASGARVCMLTAELSRRLFGYRRPIGEMIRIARDWYAVVGVMPDDGAAQVVVPLSALMPRRPADDPGQRVDALWIEWRDPAAAPQAGPAIRRALTNERAVGDAYEITVARDIATARDRTQRMLGVVGGVTAALLFLLGGLAIANAMLTSVLERTPEIGLRRAVGATRVNIVRQFLAESAIVALGGALTGTLLGVALSGMVGTYSRWTTDVSPAAVIVASACALLIGIAAGAYPARRAAGVQPIEALMHE